MREHIALEWAARLKSGEYKQGKHRLCRLDVPVDGKSSTEYCCLGVLCEMYMDYNETDDSFTHDNSVDVMEDGKDYSVRSYDGQTEFLPWCVQDWAGMTANSGRFPLDRYRSQICDLSAMNDDGATFEEIAKAIESNWKAI